MSFRLRPEDRRALDLLLDRGAVAANNGKRGTFYAGGVSQDRVRHVEKVLSLLEAMPAAEPPSDLVNRTMKCIHRGRKVRVLHPNAVNHHDRPMA